MVWPAQLTTPRLWLRPLVAADLPDLVREIGRWEVARWLTRVPHPYREADGRHWIDLCERETVRRQQLHFVAAPRLDPVQGVTGQCAIIGAIGLMLHGDGIGTAELGYWLAQDHWGRGLGTEMGRAMIRAGFVDLTLDRISAFAHPDNAPSNRILAKLGLQLTGQDPVHDYGLRGPPGIANIWQLDRRDWLKQRESQAEGGTIHGP